MTQAQVMNIEDARKRKSKRFRLVSFVLFLFVLVYIPSFIKWLGSARVTTDIIKIGKIYDIIQAEGIIIRDEVLLNTTFEGKLIPLVSEGERVGKGMKIASIINENTSQLLKELDNTEKKIAEIQSKRLNVEGVYSEDISRINSNIYELSANFIPAVENNRIYDFADIRKQINKQIYKRCEIAAGFINGDNTLKQLLNYKAEIEKKLQNNSGGIFSPCPGVVSFEIDGFEDVFKLDSINKLNVSSLKVLNNYDAIVQKPKNSMAKIIKGHTYAIALIVDKNAADILKNKQKLDIEIEANHKKLSLSVSFPVHISEQQNGKSVVVYLCDRNLETLSNQRTMKADLVYSVHEGFKVPVQSLIDFDRTANKADIMLVRSKITLRKPVKILACNEEFAIIESIDEEKNMRTAVKLYDSYVTNPNGVEEGLIIKND